MGLSQKDLCEGICSQGMLSLIEQNKHVPNATLLSKICLKLNTNAKIYMYKRTHLKMYTFDSLSRILIMR